MACLCRPRLPGRWRGAVEITCHCVAAVVLNSTWSALRGQKLRGCVKLHSNTQRCSTSCWCKQTRWASQRYCLCATTSTIWRLKKLTVPVVPPPSESTVRARRLRLHPGALAQRVATHGCADAVARRTSRRPTRRWAPRGVTRRRPRQRERAAPLPRRRRRRWQQRLICLLSWTHCAWQRCKGESLLRLSCASSTHLTSGSSSRLRTCGEALHQAVGEPPAW